MALMTAGQQNVSEWASARVKLLTCKEWRKDKQMFTEAAGEKTDTQFRD